MYSALFKYTKLKQTTAKFNIINIVAVICSHFICRTKWHISLVHYVFLLGIF